MSLIDDSLVLLGMGPRQLRPILESSTFLLNAPSPFKLVSKTQSRVSYHPTMTSNRLSNRLSRVSYHPVTQMRVLYEFPKSSTTNSATKQVKHKLKNSKSDHCHQPNVATHWRHGLLKYTAPVAAKCGITGDPNAVNNDKPTSLFPLKN